MLAKKALVAALYVAAQIMPEERWLSFAKSLARRSCARRQLSEIELSTMRKLVGPMNEIYLQEHYFVNLVAEKYLSWIHVYATDAPRRWKPQVDLRDPRVILEAKALGRPIVYLVSPLVNKGLVTRLGLAQHGLKTSFVVRHPHGPMADGEGGKWFNDRFHKLLTCHQVDNLSYHGLDTDGIKEKIRVLLDNNQDLAIPVVPIGKRNITVPFCYGSFTMATGAFALALRNHAVLLPAHGLWTKIGPVLVIGDPIMEMNPEGVAKAFAADFTKVASRYAAQVTYPLAPANGVMMIS